VGQGHEYAVVLEILVVQEVLVHAGIVREDNAREAVCQSVLVLVRGAGVELTFSIEQALLQFLRLQPTAPPVHVVKDHVARSGPLVLPGREVDVVSVVDPLSAAWWVSWVWVAVSAESLRSYRFFLNTPPFST
jgi:hypothetical protein